MNNGYSMCFNKWVLDKDIKNELGLLLIISSLCAKNGVCFATNEYFAKLFDVTEVSISTKLKKLEKKGYIKISYEKRGAEVISREIRLKNILIDDLKKFESTVKKNFKENNIIDNNIKEINNNKLLFTKKEERFSKPTIEEISSYCKERNNSVDPQRFYDFYESKGWMIGKSKMKDWKACVRTWEKNNSKKEELPSWFKEQPKETKKYSDEEQLEFSNILEGFK